MGNITIFMSTIACLVFFALPAWAVHDYPMPSPNPFGRPGGIEPGEKKGVLEEEDVLDRWFEKVTISGLVEAEYGYAKTDFDDPALEDEESSDLVLATAELGIGVDIVKHVRAQVVFLWEEDDTEPVDLDQGYITLDGEDVLPLYLNLGKIYVPFGYYETHMVSDPLTLEIGETRETAAHFGFLNDMFDISTAVFNGDINEAGDNDHVDTWVASALFTLPEDKVPDFGLVLGASYISNIADSDGLTDALDAKFGTDEIKDYVGGFHGFAMLSYLDRFSFLAEYVTAMEDFDENDVGPGNDFKPSAWNLEAAFVPIDKMTVAVRYEGSDNTRNLLPETQYGAAVSYEIFDYTTLAVEYLHGEFENDDSIDVVTAQLAVEF